MVASRNDGRLVRLVKIWDGIWDGLGVSNRKVGTAPKAHVMD